MSITEIAIRRALSLLKIEIDVFYPNQAKAQAADGNELAADKLQSALSKWQNVTVESVIRVASDAHPPVQCVMTWTWGVIAVLAWTASLVSFNFAS